MKGIRRCDSILPSIAQSLDFLISSIAHSLDHLASPAPLHKVWGFFGGGAGACLIPEECGERRGAFPRNAANGSTLTLGKGNMCCSSCFYYGCTLRIHNDLFNQEL